MKLQPEKYRLRDNSDVLMREKKVFKQQSQGRLQACQGTQDYFANNANSANVKPT